MPKKKKTMPPIHPGETLREDFLKPLGLSANRLAIELHVPVTRINDIAHCRRSISADTALRLARYFGNEPSVLDQSAGQLRSRGGPGCLSRARRESGEATPGRLND